MNSYYFFVTVGIVVSVLPFVGVPQEFKDVVFTFIGLVVVFVAQKYIKNNTVSVIAEVGKKEEGADINETNTVS